jgi:hypothetical protein
VKGSIKRLEPSTSSSKASRPSLTLSCVIHFNLATTVPSR